MSDDKKTPTGEKPLSRPASTPIVIRRANSGPVCPMCSSPSIMRHTTYWVRFGKMTLLFVVVYSLALLIGSTSDEQGIIESLLDFASLGLFGVMIWALIVAIFGKNKCKACGYKWFRD